jgi:hypothetical protein
VGQATPSAGKISLNNRPKRLDGVMEGRVLDEILLEIPTDGRSIWLNVSGKAAWDLCDGERTIAQIKSELGKHFQADERQLGADVLSLFEQLHRYGYLEMR